MIPIRVATLTGDPEREPVLAAQLDARHDVKLVLRCVDRVELLAAIRGGELDALVSVGNPQWFDREAAAEAANAEIRLVALTEDQSEAERLSALGAVLLMPDATPAEVIETCRTSQAVVPAARLNGQPAGKEGRLIGVWGSKGAPGRTSIAMEIGVQLALEEEDALLVDADTYGGDVLQLGGITEELPTIVWATRMAAKDELTSGTLFTQLRKVGRRGPVVLPGLPRAELWPEVSDYGWRQLLQVARALFRHTVVDVGFCLEPDPTPYPGPSEGRNRIARTTIREADHVVAVCRADPIGIKNFLWSFDELRSLIDVDRVLIVANRVGPRTEREVGELLRKHLGKRPVAYVPNRPAEFARSGFTGISLGESGNGPDVSAAVRTVAAALGGRMRTRGLLATLGGRK